MTLALDHLVVAARTLDDGAAWCEAALGARPQAGGRHPAMGTHNLLLHISSPRFAKAYLEIIAIDVDAPSPTRPRWFDLDTVAMQSAIASGPRLVHWVARSDDIQADADALGVAGHDVGIVAAAERMTARGRLSWHITLPDDGARPAAGAVPLLIQWGAVHPTDSLPPSAVRLERVCLGGDAASLALQLGLDPCPASAWPLGAMLTSPRGAVELLVVGER